MTSEKVSKKAKKKKGQAKKVTKKITNSSWKQKEYLLPLAIILLITFVAFIPSLNNHFVNWDDDVNLLENKNLQELSGENIAKIFNPATGTVIGNYNPLPIFTFAIEKHFFGIESAKVYHINNLLLHLLCVFFVYRLMLMMKISRTGAIIVALLFGIHPMRVESVAWVTERKDVLFAAFYLGAMITYLKYVFNKERNSFFYGLTIGLFILSLFSKIQAVALPLSMLALDYYFNRRLNQKLVLEKIPFFALSLFFGLIGVYFLAENKSLDDTTTYTFVQRLFVGAYSFCIYLIKLVFPYRMTALYPYPANLNWLFYVAPLGGFAVLGLMFYAFKKNWRGLVFGFAFFIVNVVFVLQVVGAGQGFLADRFTYMAYLGLFFLVGIAYDFFSKAKPALSKPLAIGMAVYALVFFVMTWQQCKTWKNGDTLWSHVLKFQTNTHLPYANRGHYWRGEKKYDKAIQNYNQAIALNGKKAATFNSRGKTYFDSNQNPKAIEDYTRAIQIDPTLGEAYVNRGSANAKAGDYTKAMTDFNKGLELDPEYLNGYMGRSLLFSTLGQFEKALADYDMCLKLNPNDATIWYERGYAKRRLNRPQDAMVDYNKAIQMNPNEGIFYYERAKAYLALGNKAQAKQELSIAQSKGIAGEAEFIQQLQ